ncbi:FecCD family ABC transporter permease [Niallia sp. 01092]|uniref:FecCD family ABC transporter permease n=1 Tax=unclassified Niallia TaxID=2837522 RepID=UPI003FD31230
MNQTILNKTKWNLFSLYLLLFVLLFIGICISVFIGTTSISISTLLQQWLDQEKSKELLVFETIRLPRAMLGVIIGTNLAIAGALMQALTRNPLASPQVFGINAGASFVVVFSIIFLPKINAANLVYFAFLGSVVGGFIVYSFAASKEMSNMKIALVGMAVHLLLSSFTQGMLIFNEQISNVLFWLSGAISGATWSDVKIILPWSIFGIVSSMLLAKSLTIFRLGEETAIGLGLKIQVIKLITAIMVVILAGSSVAVAGSVGFIGLMIPHIARKMVGGDYRRVIPISALCGAILLTYADVLSRFIAYPYESPVGIITAIIGAPFFLYLARNKTKKGV